MDKMHGQCRVRISIDHGSDICCEIGGVTDFQHRHCALQAVDKLIRRFLRQEQDAQSW